MDVGTGLALLGSAKIIEKVLGPTASYIGDEIKLIVEKRIKNIRSIFSKAEQRIDNTTKENLISPASPLILKTILDYGSYTEDELIHDYLAGLLVSSRLKSSQDNRASVLGLLIQNLSIYQIRTHYLFYTLIRKLYLGNDINLSKQENRSKLQTYVSITLFIKYVFKSEYDQEQAPYLHEHIMHGLNRHGLIEDSFAFGSPQHLSNFGPPKVDSPGVIFQPSILGIELFLWISNFNNNTYSKSIIEPSLNIPDIVGIQFDGEAFRTPEITDT